jgi:hypothetical protein
MDQDARPALRIGLQRGRRLEHQTAHDSADQHRDRQFGPRSPIIPHPSRNPGE